MITDPVYQHMVHQHGQRQLTSFLSTWSVIALVMALIATFQSLWIETDIRIVLIIWLSALLNYMQMHVFSGSWLEGFTFQFTRSLHIPFLFLVVRMEHSKDLLLMGFVYVSMNRIMLLAFDIIEPWSHTFFTLIDVASLIGIVHLYNSALNASKIVGYCVTFFASNFYIVKVITESDYQFWLSDCRYRALITQETAQKQKAEQMIQFFSHEIRNPESAISIAIESLLFDKTLMSAFTAAEIEMLNEIQNASDTIVSLLEDTLNYRRLMEGKVVLSLKATKLVGCLTNCVVSLQLKHKLEIKMLCDSKQLPDIVFCDQCRLEQVVECLIFVIIGLKNPLEDVSFHACLNSTSEIEFRVGITAIDCAVFEEANVEKLDQKYQIKLFIARELIALFGGRVILRGVGDRLVSIEFVVPFDSELSLADDGSNPAAELYLLSRSNDLNNELNFVNPEIGAAFLLQTKSRSLDNVKLVLDFFVYLQIALLCLNIILVDNDRSMFTFMLIFTPTCYLIRHYLVCSSYFTVWYSDFLFKHLMQAHSSYFHSGGNIWSHFGDYCANSSALHGSVSHSYCVFWNLQFSSQCYLSNFGLHFFLSCVYAGFFSNLVYALFQWRCRFNSWSYGYFYGYFDGFVCFVPV